MDRKTLNVFLASPSDLNEERNIARSECDRLNKIIGRNIGWYIDLLVWEDTLPGYTRPQELINKDVDSCDLFIGLLWKRWGQESGKYSSGFEEEFEIARSRKINNNTPEIWLYFRKIDVDNLLDPGVQLGKVIEFKSKLKESRELLYKEYEKISDWEKLFHDNLLEYILDISGISEITKIQKVSSKIESKEENTIKKELNVPKEVVNIFKSYSTTRVLYEYNKVDRLDLFVSSLATSAYSDRILSSHTLNRIFTHRNEWKLVEIEEVTILRNILGDIWYVNPGWFWFKDNNNLKKLIINIIIDENDKKIKKAALTNIYRFNIRLSEKQLDDLLRDEENLILIFSLLDSTKIDYRISVLSKYSNFKDKAVQKIARTRLIIYLFEINKEESLNKLLDYVKEDPKIIEKMPDTLIQSLGADNILNLINSYPDSFTDNFLKRIVSLKILNVEQYKSLLSLQHDKISTFSILGLQSIKMRLPATLLTSYVESSETISDKLREALISIKEELPNIEDVNAYTPDGHFIYEQVMIRNISSHINRVRSDLDDSFEGFLKQSGETLLSQFGDAANKFILKDDNREYTRSIFINTALSILTKSLIKSDIKYARIFLGSTIFGIADKKCLEIISELGDTSDINKILKIIPNINIESQLIWAKTIFALSPKIDDIIFLLKLTNNEVLRLCFNQLINLERNLVEPIGLDLINNDNQEKRFIGVALINNFYTSNELEVFLNAYTKRRTYYYNVVVSIDALLYGPEYVKEYYLKRISHEITE